MAHGPTTYPRRHGAHAGLPVVPAASGGPTRRARPAAHLRGSLQGARRALPRRPAVGVRHRLRRRRRPAHRRLRLRDRRGARALRRRPRQPRRPRHPAVPDHRRAGRPPLPGRRRSSSSRTSRRRRTPSWPPASTRPTPTSSAPPPTATPDEAEIAAMTAYDMAGTVEFAVEAKQQLLESRSETARLRQLERLLRAAVRRLDFMERAQAVARSNGKVRIGPGDPPIPKPDDLELADLFDDLLGEDLQLAEGLRRVRRGVPEGRPARLGADLVLPRRARALRQLDATASPASPAAGRARARRAATCPGAPWPAPCRSSPCRRR